MFYKSHSIGFETHEKREGTMRKDIECVRTRDLVACDLSEMTDFDDWEPGSQKQCEPLCEPGSACFRAVIFKSTGSSQLSGSFLILELVCPFILCLICYKRDGEACRFCNYSVCQCPHIPMRLFFVFLREWSSRTFITSITNNWDVLKVHPCLCI